MRKWRWYYKLMEHIRSSVVVKIDPKIDPETVPDWVAMLRRADWRPFLFERSAR